MKRMRKYAGTGLALLACVAAATPSQSAAGAEPAMGMSLLTAQAHALDTMTGYTVAHQIDVTTDNGKYRETTHSYVTTSVERPGRIRAESQHNGYAQEIVSDGTRLMAYRGFDKKYSEQPGMAPEALFRNAFPGLARELSDTNLPAAAASSQILRQDTFVLGNHSFPCDVLEVQLRPNVSPHMPVNGRIRIWVSREYKVPMQVEAAFLSADGKQPMTFVDRVTRFEAGIRFPQSTWQLAPPAEAGADAAK